MGSGMAKAGFWCSYRTGILRMLMGLYDVSAERLPHLQRVHYASDFLSRGGWGLQNHCEEVQARFSRRNIDFSASERL
jgi:hypothetical protein